MKAKKIMIAVVAVVLIAASALAFAACNKDDVKSIRTAMPDGTPALASAMLFSESKTLGGYNMTYDIVPSAGIANEMISGKADVIIMPANAGAKLIKAGKADYKMVSVSVLGSLYIIGPAGSGENGAITLDDLKGKVIASIGANNTPQVVFKHIVDNTDGVDYKLCDSQTETVGENEIGVFFYDDAAKIMTQFIDDDKNVDYALIGEPAVTAWKNNSATKDKIGGELNIQSYWKQVTEYDNFPQAALFVKSSLCSEKAFMDALLAALDENAEWVVQNKATITEYMSQYGSTSKFPPASVERCSIVNMKAADNDDMINAYLGTIIPGWSAPENFFYAA